MPIVKVVMFFIIIIFCFSCSAPKKEEITEEKKNIFEKLLGTWKLSTDEEFERFTKKSDTAYASQVFTVGGKDTNITEDVIIYGGKGKWNFKTLVKGQNKGKAIVFTSTILSDSIVQFENPTHDFPRMINYTLISHKQMRAFIAGTGDTIYFNYSKIVPL